MSNLSRKMYEETTANNIAIANRVCDSFVSKYGEMGKILKSQLSVLAKNAPQKVGYAKVLLSNAIQKFTNEGNYSIADSVISYDKEMKALSDSAYSSMLAGGSRISDSAYSEMSNYTPFVRTLLTSIIPFVDSNPLSEFCNVQAMTAPMGVLFRPRLVNVNAKAPFGAGEVVFGRGDKGTAGMVHGDHILDEEHTGVTASAGYYKMNVQYPYVDVDDSSNKGQLLAGTRVAITDNSSNTKKYFASAIVNGNYTFREKGATTDSGITLSADGILSVPAPTTGTYDKFVVSYVINIEQVPEASLPTLKEDASESSVVTVRPQIVMSEMDVFSQFYRQSLAKGQGMEGVVREVIDYIIKGNASYVCEELYSGSTNDVETFNITTSGTVTSDTVWNNFNTKLNTQAQRMLQANGHMPANIVICGQTLYSFVSSFFSRADSNMKPFGSLNGWNCVSKMGESGAFKYFFNPAWVGVNANKAVLTYKDDKSDDAAFYVGEYLPLTTSDMVTIGQVSRQSLYSLTAFDFVNRDCSIPLNVNLA